MGAGAADDRDLGVANWRPQTAGPEALRYTILRQSADGTTHTTSILRLLRVFQLYLRRKHQHVSHAKCADNCAAT
jgi:hypothetical protein